MWHMKARCTRVYLSGPMSGIPLYNFPMFHAFAGALRRMGWEVANPAEFFDGATDLPYVVYMRRDLEELGYCHAVAVLPGWEHSSGAMKEVAVAQKMLELPIYDARTMERIYPVCTVTAGMAGEW